MCPLIARKIFPVLAIFLVGCKTLSHQSIDNNFPGIQAAMQEKPITCILFVHGIGGYSNDDPTHILTMINAMPNMKAVTTSQDVPFADADTAGTLIRQDFVDTSNNHQLRTYTLTWEPVTDPLKKDLLGYDQLPANTSTRLPLINSFRNSLMDIGLPDVVLYVGQYKSAIQRTVKDALRQIHRDLQNRPDTHDDYEFVFVTWSLGSKIIFDCLAESHITADPSATADTQPSEDDVTFSKIAEKTRSVFMLANQIPLLTLGDIPSPRQTNRTPTTMPYQNLLSVARRRRYATTHPDAASTTQPANAPLTIVAFSDPNDLLSYPIPDWLEQTKEANFANVSISVATTAYYIPFVGWIANPLTAHTAYAIRDNVVKIILYGPTGKPLSPAGSKN